MFLVKIEKREVINRFEKIIQLTSLLFILKKI